MAEIRVLTEADASVLDRVDPDVFDGPVDPQRAAELLGDPRHHLAVALHDEVVVGMASAVHYVHPDKAPELWINEVGVAAAHRRRGIAQGLLRALFARGRELGCTQAWVLADRSNAAAHRLYASAGGRPAAEPSIMFEFPLDAAPAAARRGVPRPLEFRFYYFTPRYDETVAFYRDTLQLSVHDSWDGPDARGTIFRAPGGTGLIEIEAGTSLPSLAGGCYIEVPDVEAWYARVRDAGAPIIRELRTTSYGHRHFKVIDPSGIEIGFFEQRACAH